jgi:hypothetical protein
MSTSERNETARDPSPGRAPAVAGEARLHRIALLEAAGASLLLVGVVALAAPHDVWLEGFGLHPMWLPVIVLAARYATRGLFPALAFTGGGLIVASLALEGSLTGLAARTSSAADLLALGVAILVAWVAMLHESRIGRVVQRLAEASEAQRQAEENVHALHASLRYLRSRHDRLDASLSFWRNVAGRLERGDAGEAARAVLELCELRLDARAGTVQLRDGDRFVPLAGRGQWSPTSARPQDLERDVTVRAAIEACQVMPAGPGATEGDSDVVAPIVDDDGAVIGVIALRGVSPGCMRAADLRDLGVIAQWLAPAVARQLRRQLGRAIAELQGASRSKTEVSL